MKQKFKWIPTGGYGIDWRGCVGYSDTLEKAAIAGAKFLQSESGRRDIRMRATACVISHRRPGTEGRTSQWRDVAKVLTDGTVHHFASGYNPLLEPERLELVRTVSKTVFDNSESVCDGDLGADLAYLIMAIVHRDWCFVDWTIGEPCELLKLLDATTPVINPVWLFIKRNPST